MRIGTLDSQGRILMLVQRYSPAIGGVERHVAMISKKLKDSGFEVTILTCAHEKGLASSEISEGIRIVRIPYDWDRNPFLSYTWILKNRKKILSNEIIHIHDTMPFLAWYLPLRFLFPIKPIYLTFHGYDRDPVPMIFIILRKIARKLSRGILCIGRFIDKIYSVQCDKNIVGAVVPQETSNKQRSGAVFIGRLERDTGIERYIESIHLLEKEKGVRMRFTLCGGGSIEQELKELADTLNVDIEFMGIVTNPLEILTSKEVCFAGGYLSILEANATGTPVIAITQSYLKFQYFRAMREAGGVVSIQTAPEGIVNEIVRLHKSSTLSKSIALAGIEFAKTKTWDYLMDQYIEVWNL